MKFDQHIWLVILLNIKQIETFFLIMELFFLNNLNFSFFLLQVETRVVQLPNNVTCVRVGDNLEGMPPPRQQFYDIPVR